MLHYLGMEQAVYGYSAAASATPCISNFADSFSSTLRSPTLVLTENGVVANLTTDNRRAYVFGEHVFNSGVVRWSLRIDVAPVFFSAFWIMFCIIGANQQLENTENSYRFSSTYAWSSSCQIFAAGISTTGGLIAADIHAGDEIVLTLDIPASKLVLQVSRTGRRLEMSIRVSQSWRLHLSIMYAPTQVRLLSTTQTLSQDTTGAPTF